jgi:hypothetical protein
VTTELGATRGQRAAAPDPLPSAPARARADRRLYYVGRCRDPRAPAGSLALDCWDVLPVRLGPLLDDADALAILDPMSFPCDALRDRDRDIPLAVRLPDGWGAEELVALFGVPLLDALTPLDAVAVADDEVWSALRARYAWPERIRDADATLADAPPEQPPAVARRHKAAYRRLGAAITEQLAPAIDAIPRGELPRALLLAEDAEQWAALPALSGAEVLAPESDCVESAHIALSVGALGGCSDGERRRRLRSLLRALRIGGRLIVAERFLEGRGGSAIGAPPPRALLAEILEASARLVALEHVEAIRFRGDDLTGTGLFAFTKLGRPERL